MEGHHNLQDAHQIIMIQQDIQSSHGWADQFGSIILFHVIAVLQGGTVIVFNDLNVLKWLNVNRGAGGAFNGLFVVFWSFINRIRYE